jgi:putative ABC transport system substrate-binding protein
MLGIRRREFITLLGGAGTWPLTAVAQQPGKVWRVGFVAGGARPVPFESGPYIGFQIGMRELGYVEGENLAIAWRFAEGHYELFPEFAREFARLQLDAIVSGFSGAVLPMQRANPATPIVMAYSSDPVALGLVSSLARPGGNTTGLASALEETVAKQLDLLVAAVPNLSRVAVLLNPANASSDVGVATLESAAKQTGIILLPLRARTVQEIESVFSSVDTQRAGALIARVDALFFSYRERIAQLALEHRLPSMFGQREHVQAGGLMSYGGIEEFYRRAATYVNRIFRGAKPADLPVERPTKFYLVINRRTARGLGISIPRLLSMFAEEVIE